MIRCPGFDAPCKVCLCLVIFLTISSTIFDKPVNALTISTGEPFSGRLINGVQFPSQLHGYKLLDEKRSFTTPEVVGALLEAAERFEAGIRILVTSFWVISQAKAEGGSRATNPTRTDVMWTWGFLPKTMPHWSALSQ